MRKFVLGLAIVLAAHNSASAQAVQFKIPLRIQSGTVIDTLWFGVHGDGPKGEILDNTYGLDLDTAYGEWVERPYPPDFPGITYSCKFMDLPRRSELLSGMRPYDFRGFKSASQVDSFAVSVYGLTIARNSLTMSWPDSLNKYGKSWKLLKKDGTKYKVVVRDMNSITSYTDPNSGHDPQQDFLLIKYGLKVEANKQDH